MVLQEHGIEIQYNACVETIFNHHKDGFCPMETATRHIDDPEKALAAIRKTLEKLHG